MASGWERFIACYLLQKFGPGEWGYKDMEESMGPAEVSCPIAYLKMVPDPGGYATEWRAKVRADFARRHRKLRVGERVALVEGCRPPSLVLTSLRPLRGTHGGQTYRLKRRHLAAVSP